MCVCTKCMSAYKGMISFNPLKEHYWRVAATVYEKTFSCFVYKVFTLMPKLAVQANVFFLIYELSLYLMEKWCAHSLRVQ